MTMNRNLGTAAFVLGGAAVAWVGWGYLGSHPLALAITVLIAAAYGAGALELRRYDQATQTLSRALAALRETPPSLGGWLDRLHPSLRQAVRLRIEGERIGLPGPALTPYLVGLLVLLGMLGTFLGMVVTLNGAVLALQTTTDLPAIRAALTAPVQGLGLAFGTSIAGVAASAMLGLMSALCRRARLQAAQALDSAIATVLHAHSGAHQRQATLAALQTQARALPDMAGHLQALVAQMALHSQSVNAQLLDNQERFHEHALVAYRDLASAVDASLQRSLVESARAAGAALQPVVETTMAGLAQAGARLHDELERAVRQQLDGVTARLDAAAAALQNDLAVRDEQRLAAYIARLDGLMASVAEVPRAAAAVMGELRGQLRDSLARDNQLLAERHHILQGLSDLLAAVQQGASEQRGAIEALVASSATLLQAASTQATARFEAESAQLTAVAAQVTGSAVEVASLGEAFGFGVRLFSASNEGLIATLQRIETTLGKSTARSDEQLAYYVAQAREIIDLSILSQRQIVEDLQQIAGRPAARVAEPG
jgi:hypothetical protein